MLGTMLFVFGSFGVLIFLSYRKARRSSFQPEGKLRWDGGEAQPSREA